MYTFKITPCAASILSVPDLSGNDILLCSADELNDFSTSVDNKKIIAVYGDNPKQAYACRKAAYDYADACLTLSQATAERLQLLHPKVLHADSAQQVLQNIATYGLEWPSSIHEISKESVTTGPMTILFVTHDFRVGGLEQVVIDIASLAQKQGHRPIISYAGFIDEITRKDVECAGIEHVRLPESHEERKAFLRERNISIVNAHYATILAQECQALDIPYLQTIHNMYLWLDEAGIAQWRELDKLTSAYIAVSANAAMVADLRLGLPPEKMVIVPNGTDIIEKSIDCPPEQDDALRAEFGIPSTGIVFVQVASLSGVKAHAVCIEAFAEALHTRKDIYLILLGKESDPTYGNLVRKKIAQYGLGEHVFMPGYRKDVPRFLNLARAMVAPSFIEGWSLAISEALQLGVPVIATNVGGACEQLQKGNNIILPAMLDDVASLTAQEFFNALTDENFHKKAAYPLTAAFLKAAEECPRAKPQKNMSVLSTACAYAAHIKMMQLLIQKMPFYSLREDGYTIQRQNEHVSSYNTVF